MSQQIAPVGLEPVADVKQPALPARRPNRRGLRVTVRGRSIRLRGLRQTPAGVLRWLSILGPGIIAGAAGNDAGGIATYSQTGAKFGYDLLWVLLLITFSLAVVQEMSGRLGAATGRGLLDLIRERYGLGWALFAVGIVLVANGGLIISEFVGVGAAAELLGVSKFVAVPFAAALIWLLVVLTNYGRVEKVFLTVSLVFLAYPVAAILSHPHWNAVAHGLFVPRVHLSADYVMLLVGLMGSAMTPYQQLFQQSSTVEKGVARRHYGPERVDTYAGSVFNTLMAAFIVIATATTLNAVGKTTIGSAAEAAQALGPVAGKAAAGVFAVGLLGASLLAGAVLPLATAYSVAEAFGFPKGVNLDFRRARTFFRLFSLLIVLGGGVALIPKLPVIQLLVWIQVLNGMLLPIILVFNLLLINDRRLCSDLKNTRLLNVLGWGTFALVTTAVLVLLASQLLQLFGVNLPGAG